MTRRNWMGFAAMLVAGLFLAGCGGDDNGLSSEDMARIAAAEDAAMMAQEEAATAHEEAEEAKEDAAAADMRAMEAEAAAAAAQAEAEKEVEIPEPDTSDLEDTIAVLEEQIEELEEDAEMEAERVSLLSMSASARIISLLDGTAPAGSAADVAAMRAGIEAGLKGVSTVRNLWYNGNTASIIPNAVIAGAGLFFDFNGDGVYNTDADGIGGTSDDLIGGNSGTTATINELVLGRDLNGSGALESTVAVYSGAITAVNPSQAASNPILLDERMYGQLDGDTAGAVSLVPLNLVIESAISGPAGNPITGGLDLNGDGVIQTVAYSTGTGIDESALATLIGFPTDDVGAELRGGDGSRRYLFQYDDDGDNQPADVRIGADGDGSVTTGTASAIAAAAAVTPEGIDMADHLSTFALTPVAGVDGVSLVMFSIDSAYSSEGNLHANVTTPSGAPTSTLPLPVDPTNADDVPTTQDGRYGVESYGAWLKDSFFGIHKFTAVTNLGANTAGTSAGTSAAAAATASRWIASRGGGNPSTLRGLGETATWTGAMVGHDTLASAEADMLVQGNAMLQAHIVSETLAATRASGMTPVIDVMFSNITNQEGMDARVTEMEWKNLDFVTAANGGAGFLKARTGTANAEIEGWLFDDANEIVGTFDNNSIVGAFGATLDADAGMMDMASDQ